MGYLIYKATSGTSVLCILASASACKGKQDGKEVQPALNAVMQRFGRRGKGG